MAFLRFTRDPRGYENFYLVEATTNRRGKTRSRVLYWFRTPPHVKVGRAPFDQSVREALEQQNPGVEFDWQKILDTPIPSADAEKWRERRRLEKAEKAARRAAEATDPDDASEMAEPPAVDELRADTSGEQALDPSIEPAECEPADEPADDPEDDHPPHAVEAAAATPMTGPEAAAATRRRRRRRRRGRGGRPPEGGAPPVDAAS
jgi:hypothetical protein